MVILLAIFLRCVLALCQGHVENKLFRTVVTTSQLFRMTAFKLYAGCRSDVSTLKMALRYLPLG